MHYFKLQKAMSGYHIVVSFGKTRLCITVAYCSYGSGPVIGFELRAAAQLICGLRTLYHQCFGSENRLTIEGLGCAGSRSCSRSSSWV